MNVDFWPNFFTEIRRNGNAIIRDTQYLKTLLNKTIFSFQHLHLLTKTHQNVYTVLSDT